MKSNDLRKNFEAMKEMDADSLCDAASNQCNYNCNSCPFLNSETLKKAINELQNMLDKEVEGGV